MASQALRDTIVQTANSMTQTINMIGTDCETRLRNFDDTKDVRQFLRQIISSVEYNKEQLTSHMIRIHNILNQEEVQPK